MIFIAGPHGAGKTKSAEIMARFGFLCIDLGPTLRKIHSKNDTGLSFEMWLRENERIYGPFFTDELLIAEILRAKEFVERGKDCVDIAIVGSRSKIGIEKICAVVPNVNNHVNYVIFIDAKFGMLLERYNSREKVGLDSESFSELLKKDLSIGLDSIRGAADFMISNDSDVCSLESKIREIIFQRLCYETRS